MARRPQLHHWFRLGYAIRGLVYMTLGMLAWQSGRGQSAHSTVEQLRDMPAGPLLLLAAAVGLTGLGLFRLGDALFDFDHRGDGWTKRLARLGRAGGGVGYLGLALLAARLLVGLQQSDGAMIDTARQVRGVPGGALLLLGAGFVAIISSGAQVGKAWSCKFMQFLDPAAPRPVRWLGRFGYAARGLLFFLVGWALVRAGLGGHRIHDVGGALDAIREHRWSFRAITGGLFLFGGFSLLEARYRILPAEKDVIRKVEQGLDEIITPAA